MLLPDNQDHSPKLIIVGGCMFSGKTTWLLNYINNLPLESFQLFKPDIDKRYSLNECVTHNGEKIPALILDAEDPNLPIMDNKVKTILIDELNFFNTDSLLRAIRQQLAIGRTVIGAGLFYDHKKKPFGATLNLAKIADEIIQLYAKCDGCGKKAEHVYRKFKNKKRVILGTSATYGACCINCWEIFNNKYH